ncbi:hypothetical protein TPY_2383 [Sulfobacillus acidophilus TPY]|uniref:Flagellar biosynthesis protein FliO n=1 Tax=Sulfobacillus acidophilus (strain ATCC 700253 / DSM 10332 / NAL) TaxID=679936 RepID=G8U1I1_SULAD|nr:hypothetical protein TPY_2383 [Sulfobacillus acidophilus TPY]AEW06586.1 flagellar biosynthesis protein FliO [Sulfobacillus acidophilus DSM 10332]
MGIGIFFRFLWAMVLVVGLAYGAARMLKKIGFGRTSPSRYLTQIDYLPLGPKRGVALVQIVDRTVALGVTDESVSLLMDIDPQAMAERAPMTLEAADGGVSFSQFTEELVKRLRRERP